MIDHFLEFHKTKPVLVDLPEFERMEVFITNKNVCDEYSNEYYLNVNIPNRDSFTKLTNKMIEHYVYEYMVSYLKLFSIEGNIYIRFTYL